MLPPYSFVAPCLIAALVVFGRYSPYHSNTLNRTFVVFPFVHLPNFTYLCNILFALGLASDRCIVRQTVGATFLCHLLLFGFYKKCFVLNDAHTALLHNFDTFLFVAVCQQFVFCRFFDGTDIILAETL